MKRLSILRSSPGVILLGIFGLLSLWVWLPARPETAPTGTNIVPNLSDNIAHGRSRISELITVTSERPLFHVSRRPPASIEQPTDRAAAEPDLTLVGVLGDQGNNVALVRLTDSEQLYRLDVGQQLGQFQIVAIGETSIQVSKDGGEPERIAIGE